MSLFFSNVLGPCAFTLSDNLQSPLKLQYKARAQKEKYCWQKYAQLENFVTKEPFFRQPFLRVLEHILMWQDTATVGNFYTIRTFGNVQTLELRTSLLFDCKVLTASDTNSARINITS